MIAIKLLDARRGLNIKCRELFKDGKIAEAIYRYLLDGIEECEDAQPEIILCKDCKHYQFAPERAFGFPVKRCEVTGFEDVEDNDFCSRGERR